jgi:hypothetical protein
MEYQCYVSPSGTYLRACCCEELSTPYSNTNIKKIASEGFLTSLENLLELS